MRVALVFGRLLTLLAKSGTVSMNSTRTILIVGDPMDDRRTAPRIPLDAPCLLTLTVDYEEETFAMVVDVSRGGIQLALPPGSKPVQLTIGQPVTLKDVSAPLDLLLEDAHGKIAWIGANCCGVKLNKELPIAQADVVDLARL